MQKKQHRFIGQGVKLIRSRTKKPSPKQIEKEMSASRKSQN